MKSDCGCSAYCGVCKTLAFTSKIILVFVFIPIGEIEPLVKEGFLVQATKVNQKMVMRRMFLLKVGFAFYFAKI